MTKSNHQLLSEFFDTIIKLVSEGTADTYAVMVMKKITNEKKRRYPFLADLTFKKNTVIVSKDIDKYSPQDISAFITELIDSIFSDLFKHLLRKKMSEGLYKDLKQIGVEL